LGNELAKESWGGSIELPPFRLPGGFLIVAGIVGLRQSCELAGRSDLPVWKKLR
jgi:hypothetical protein